MYKLYMVRMFIHVFCLLLQQHNENLESFLFSSLCSFLIRKDGISLTYATLNSQLKKSSCYKCWRMVSKVWKCIQYATLWIEECCCLVKDSMDERRQKSAALFFSPFHHFCICLSSVFFFYPHYISSCYLCFILHVFMLSVAKAWLVLSSFSHHLLSCPCPFSFRCKLSLLTYRFSSVLPLEFVGTDAVLV